MDTDQGPIALDRADGTLATLSIQGQPDRAVALKRRETAELIAEELRRLDPDETYASALRFGVDRLTVAEAETTAPADTATATATASASAEPAARKTAPARKTAARKAPANSATAAKTAAKKAPARKASTK
jgi:hypothetical protein